MVERLNPPVVSEDYLEHSREVERWNPPLAEDQNRPLTLFIVYVD
jgi:hypothetical protein